MPPTRDVLFFMEISCLVSTGMVCFFGNPYFSFQQEIYFPLHQKHLQGGIVCYGGSCHGASVGGIISVKSSV